MEGYDLLSDSYSAELIAVMIAERLWSKISGYLDEKAEKKAATKLTERLADMDKKIDINTALDKHRNGRR